MEPQNPNPENKESELLNLLERSEKKSTNSVATSNSNLDNNIASTNYYKSRTEKINDFKKGLLFSSVFLFAVFKIGYIDLVEGYTFIFYQPIYIILSSITLAIIIFVISKIVKRYYLVSGFLIGVYILPPLTLLTIAFIAMSIIFLFTGQTHL